MIVASDRLSVYEIKFTNEWSLGGKSPTLRIFHSLPAANPALCMARDGPVVVGQQLYFLQIAKCIRVKSHIRGAAMRARSCLIFFTLLIISARPGSGFGLQKAGFNY